MSIAGQNAETVDRQLVAAEMLELGQALFDDLIAFAETHHVPTDEGEAFPVEDVRAAAGEFFRALQLLLQLKQHNEQR